MEEIYPTFDYMNKKTNVRFKEFLEDISKPVTDKY
jgi:hypothetical protein